MILALSIAGIMIAIVPAAMFLKNLPLFSLPEPKALAACALQPAPDASAFGSSFETRLSVSVLIPARDEADSIGQSIESALACGNVDVEIIVLDDHSTDGTAEIVKQFAKSDARVRYLQSAPLPALWNGKQHACKQLAESASHEQATGASLNWSTPQDAGMTCWTLVRMPKAQAPSGPATRRRCIRD